MLNQVVLLGRLTKNIELKENEEGKKYAIATLAVPRSFKNEVGIYETDFINCSLWYGTAERAIEYCKKGDLISIRGRLQTKENKLEVIAERITFLNSKKSEDE